MDRFFRAIGFDELNVSKKIEIMEYVLSHAISIRKVLLETGVVYAEIRAEVADEIGVYLYGTFDKLDVFHSEKMIPYHMSQFPTRTADITVGKSRRDPLLSGYCNNGINIHELISFLFLNATEFYGKKYSMDEFYEANLYFSGLSNSGTIILGTNFENSGMLRVEKNLKRNINLRKFRETYGNEIDDEFHEEAEELSDLMDRVVSEDLYSVVDTSFIPDENNQFCYHILATIVNWTVKKNYITGIELYKLMLNCNDMIFSICIRKQDVTGVPAIGRRFKGTIMLQGRVEYIGLLN